MDSWWHKSVTPNRLYDSPTLFDERSFKTNDSINKKYIIIINVRVTRLWRSDYMYIIAQL